MGEVPEGEHRGNFLTYINRCIKVFGMNEKVHLIKERHWKHMQSKLHKPYKKAIKK
jgi:hypothetical protein